MFRITNFNKCKIHLQILLHLKVNRGNDFLNWYYRIYVLTYIHINYIHINAIWHNAFGYNVILHYFVFDIKKETEVSTLIAVFYRLKKSSSEYFNWNIIRLPCTSRSSKNVELLVTFVRRNIQQCFYRTFTYKQVLIAILKIWYSTIQKVTWGYHAYFKLKKIHCFAIFLLNNPVYINNSAFNYVKYNIFWSNTT